ncbi:hypothetical protein FZEAL_6261 [Fusarium zealandicum]|uniref:Uncharacterized protein n=1 Tax=Fusarium zealandicum TaxID=1053134 RepID=A0A8H4UI47_9HYPO|nr:hypothetical protein FZEAL_6261 [Fusarium zealandicum]
MRLRLMAPNAERRLLWIGAHFIRSGWCLSEWLACQVDASYNLADAAKLASTGHRVWRGVMADGNLNEGYAYVCPRTIGHGRNTVGTEEIELRTLIFCGYDEGTWLLAKLRRKPDLKDKKRDEVDFQHATTDMGVRRVKKTQLSKLEGGEFEAANSWRPVSKRIQCLALGSGTWYIRVSSGAAVVVLSHLSSLSSLTGGQGAKHPGRQAVLVLSLRFLSVS